MSAPQPRPEPPNAGHTESYLHILHQLMDVGTAFAHLLLDQAKAQATPSENPPDPPSRNAVPLALAYDRVARAVRRTILLARKLAEPPEAPAPASPNRTAARKRIIREVEDAIQRETEGAVAKSLDRELLERLDSPDLEDELATRPVKDIIADICRDLGIAHIYGTHPWKRRTPADIAELFSRAAWVRGLGPDAPSRNGVSEMIPQGQSP